jgi:transcriptional regulator with XRE-family HTH domain
MSKPNNQAPKNKKRINSLPDAIVGASIRKARLSLPGELSTLKTFGAMINCSEPYLSQLESGSRPINVEKVMQVAELTEKDPGDFFGNASVRKSLFGRGFKDAAHFLGTAEKLGIIDIFPDRTTGLKAMAPFLGTMMRGEVAITGSSLRGLFWDKHHPFVEALRALIRERHEVQVKVILTNPKISVGREELEGRTAGSIAKEIFDGVAIIKELGVPDENIRFIDASPTMFSIFCSSPAAKIGFINPMTLGKQGFLNFGLLLRSVVNDSQNGTDLRGLYEDMYQANFELVWNNPKVTQSISASSPAHETTKTRSQ